MSRDSTFTPVSEEQLPRSERRVIEAAAYLRESAGKPVMVKVVNLSVSGVQIAHHRAFPRGTSFWLRLPGLEALRATTIWSDGRHLGCRFDVPLHQAVLDRLVELSG